MTGWQWFWTLIGFIAYIIVLIFLYFYEPFRLLFGLVLNGIGYGSIVFWVVIITAMLGFCWYHWQAYRHHIVLQPNMETMISASLLGSAFTAILLSGGATLQAVMVFCYYLLQNGYRMDQEFGTKLGAILALVILTGVFCILFWLLKIIRLERQPS